VILTDQPIETAVPASRLCPASPQDLASKCPRRVPADVDAATPGGDQLRVAAGYALAPPPSPPPPASLTLSRRGGGRGGGQGR